ncbi:MAG: hypothetical protein ABI823_16505 [Bryobacteraceae bacterium]
MTRPKVRGKWLLFAGITILIAIAVGAVVVWRREAKAVKPAVVAAPPPPAPEGNEISLTGRIRAQKVLVVGASIGGLLENFFVEVGQEVYEGQLLGRIRNGKFESDEEVANAEFEKAQTRLQSLEASQIAARLEASRATADAQRAKAELDRAERVYQRQSMLMREGATPRLQYEKADREYKSAKAEFENLEAVSNAAEDRATTMVKEIERSRQVLNDRAQAMENTKASVGAGEMVAPADGLVIALHGSPGEQVTIEGNRDMVQLAIELTSLEAVVEPPPPALARIKPGLPARIRIAELISEPLVGSVARIDGNQVVVQFLSPNTGIKPGLTAQVTIQLN